MDAVTILRNEKNNHRVMQIDLDEIAMDETQLEDVYDILAVEMRKTEETVCQQSNRQLVRFDQKEALGTQ